MNAKTFLSAIVFYIIYTFKMAANEGDSSEISWNIKANSYHEGVSKGSIDSFVLNIFIHTIYIYPNHEENFRNISPSPF